MGQLVTLFEPPGQEDAVGRLARCSNLRGRPCPVLVLSSIWPMRARRPWRHLRIGEVYDLRNSLTKTTRYPSKHSRVIRPMTTRSGLHGYSSKVTTLLFAHRQVREKPGPFLRRSSAAGGLRRLPASSTHSRCVRSPTGSTAKPALPQRN